MTAITVPAVKVRQGNMVLYTTSIKVRDLVSENFYSIDVLDPKDPENEGFQRVLEKKRANKLAKYIVDGQEEGDVLLPTSVFLATDKDISFDDGKITIDVSAVCPFSVVDGQHRLEGLKTAAQKDEGVLDFEVPVNIAIGLNKLVQMCHFLVVNTTQKIVDKGIEQRIIARLSKVQEIENIPTLPHWIIDRVQVGDEEKALMLLEYLNQTSGSPWEGKVKMANALSRKGTLIAQKTFVKAIVDHVLSHNNHLADMDIHRGQIILVRYWQAIANILDSDGKSSVLYKYNGVNLFCRFSTDFFSQLAAEGKAFNVENMEKKLRQCFENMDGEHFVAGTADYWRKGGQASGLNQTSMGAVHKAMVKSMKSGDNIKIDED